ncbi:MAG: adenylate/guanylate cyclase domain-containing protein [Acidobacteria bacterium]|nr:adenylate/guanylate cyclase domain-containing protein [Acidobacteriota bacterium]
MSGPESTANLTPWVPLAARQWLHASDPEVKHRVVEGSTLFADISGFTKLSERLDRIGLEGAEHVTEVIADAFNRLLEPAYSYGGTLVKFGGDALLLFYQGEDHELRAASSALEMRRRENRSRTPTLNKVGQIRACRAGDDHCLWVGQTARSAS